MAVLVELHNTGDATIRTEVQAIVQHVLSGWPGEWRVSIVGSRANENWEMKVEGPNGFERWYTLGKKCRRASTCGHRESAPEAAALEDLIDPANQLDFQKSSACIGLPRDKAEIENDFQKKCRKGAKFAAHTAFSAILGEISCLFSLALDFSPAFEADRFNRPRTSPENSCQWPVVSCQLKPTTND